jgi:hypothetical protein
MATADLCGMGDAGGPRCTGSGRSSPLRTKDNHDKRESYQRPYPMTGRHAGGLLMTLAWKFKGLARARRAFPQGAREETGFAWVLCDLT